MVVGYWLNLFFPNTDCNHVSFCVAQFVFLQLGNMGIVLSEFAMTLEVLILTQHLKHNTLVEIMAGPPREIKIAYAFFGALAVASVVTGIWLYVGSAPAYDEGLACYLDSWCW